jgi:hypothetical protein
MGARSRGDREESDRLARSMVADDIDERHGSYFVAVLTVLENAIENEDAAEGLDFIERHQPGFNDPSSNTIAEKVRWAQGGAFWAWYVAKGPVETAALVDDYWRILQATGFSIDDDPIIYLEVLAIRGKTDEAIDYALNDIVSLPITEAIWWREIFDAPYMVDVVSDSRVQAQLQQWDEDLIAVRADVGAFLEGVH